MPDLYRVVLPFIGIFVAALLITTYVPKITLFSVPPSENAALLAPTPTPTENAAPTPEQPAGNCDEPGEDESFEDFDRRCNVSGGGGDNAGAAPSAPAQNCEQPGPDESFEDFDRRCNVSGAPAAPTDAPAAPEAAPDAPTEPAPSGEAGDTPAIS